MALFLRHDDISVIDMTPSQPRGFIALMSAIIISAVLLILATGGSLGGFYTRMNSLNAEYKEKTYSLAQACVAHTLLALSQDSSYAGNATTTLSATEICYTGAVATSGISPNNVYTFRTRSYLMNTYTNLEVVAKVQDLSVQTQTEIPSF